MSLRKHTQKETEAEYFDRTYCNMEGTVLVWPSVKEKENILSKPEKWDMETSQNYLNYLRNGA